jgi:nucleotide-binding universal stress UspA family protein
MSRAAVRRILHPSDFSPASRAAFAKAIELARDNRAELLVLHVRGAVAPVIGDDYISPQAYESIERASREETRRQLSRLVEQARRRGVRVRALMAQGTAHDEILRAARRGKVDMIVMGTHGRTGLARFFIGSVASRVVAQATCPVLTVRGRARSR